MNGRHSAEITLFVFIRVNWGQTKKGSAKISVFTLQWKPLIQLALCLWMYKYNCAGNVKLQREFGGRLGKEYIMDTFSHPRLSMKLLLSRFLAVEEIYWGKSFASWIFYQGASQDFFPEFLSHKRGDICPEEKANSPRRAPGMVWTASEVELTPSASLQHKMWSDGFYTL